MSFTPGGSGNNSSISSAGDVALDTVTDGQLLAYNGSIDKWVNRSAGTQSQHASTHAANGSDPVNPSSIGAASASGGGREAVKAMSSSGLTPTIDIGTGNVQVVTLTGNATMSFTGSVDSVSCSFSLYVKQDAAGDRFVTWPASVKWPEGIVPILSAGPGQIDLVVFETIDNGTTWYGNLAGVNYR